MYIQHRLIKCIKSSSLGCEVSCKYPLLRGGAITHGHYWQLVHLAQTVPGYHMLDHMCL